MVRLTHATSLIPRLLSLILKQLIIRVEKLGYSVPAFDFRLPGVTSMSADIHKYGLGAKVSRCP